MKKRIREETKATEPKAFPGRSVLVSGLSKPVKEELASALVLDTVRKIAESNSMKEQYARLLVFHSTDIARKRGMADKTKTIGEAIRQLGIAEFEIRVAERTGKGATYVIDYGGGRYKTISLPDDILGKRDSVSEVRKRLKGRTDTIPDLRSLARHDTIPDFSLLGVSPYALSERMVAFHGLGGEPRKNRFTYHGVNPESSFGISAEIEGKNLITAIDLKITRAHKDSKCRFVPGVLEAQGTPNLKALEKVPAKAKAIAAALNRLVGDREVIADMVPLEYFDAFLALRKTFTRIGAETDVKLLGAAMSMIDHPAFSITRNLPKDFFEMNGELNLKGMERVMKAIAGEACLLSDKTLSNMAQAYSLVIKDDDPLGWDRTKMRSKHFVMASKIRTFLLEQFPGMKLEQ